MPCEWDGLERLRAEPLPDPETFVKREIARLRGKLMIGLQAELAEWDLSQTVAAARLGTQQPRVSALERFGHLAVLDGAHDRVVPARRYQRRAELGKKHRVAQQMEPKDSPMEPEDRPMEPKDSPKPVVFSAERQEGSADQFDIFFPKGYARAGYLNFPDTNGKTGNSVRWMRESDAIKVGDWNGGLLVRMNSKQAKQRGFELSLLEPVSKAAVNVAGMEPQHSVIATAAAVEQPAVVEEPLPQVPVGQPVPPIPDEPTAAERADRRGRADGNGRDRVVAADWDARGFAVTFLAAFRRIARLLFTAKL